MSSISGTTSATGGLALSGVYSSIDTTTLVNKLMSVEAQGLTLLQSHKAKADAKSSAISSIQTLVTNLETVANALKDPTKLRQVSVNSTDSTVLTASSTGGATAGSHSITVNRLATSMREVQAGLASDTALVGEGKFVYTYDGQTRTILTSATTTLTDLVNQINTDQQNPGVHASLLDYKVDDAHQSHLVLSGADTGGDKAIAITSDTTLGAFADGSANWTVTQSAQNSQYSIDGYPPSGGWLEQDGNTVTTAVPGVSVTFQKPGTASVNMSRDTSAISNGLGSLVSAYNALADKIHAYTAYDSTTKTSGPLQGDANISGLLSQVRSQLTSALPGFDASTDTYASAAQIGLSIDKNGDLSLDSTVLIKALSTNYDQVLNVISASRAGSSSASLMQFNYAGPNTHAGQYDVQVDYDASGNITAGRMRLMGATAWDAATIGADGKNITGKTGTAEEGLVVATAWDGTSATQSAAISVQDGFANSLYNVTKSLLDPVNGMIHAEHDSFQASSDQIQKQIDAMNTRLAQRQLFYQNEFARMETVLAQLGAQKSQFDAIFGTNSSSNSSSSSG